MKKVSISWAGAPYEASGLSRNAYQKVYRSSSFHAQEHTLLVGKPKLAEGKYPLR